MKKIKEFIAKIIEPEGKPSPISVVYHIIMGIIIVLSCAAVFVDVWLDVPEISEFIHTFELVTVCIFSFECLVKLFVADEFYPESGFFKSRSQYLTSFDFFIDFVCIISIFLNNIPSAFGTIKFIKLVKLTRLVKLNDINDGAKAHEKVTLGDKIKKRVYKVMNGDENDGILSKIYDIFAIIVIIASVSTIIIETFIHEGSPHYSILFTLEVIFTCLFVIEYILRVWSAEYLFPELDKDHAKTKYIFTFMSIIDILAILPFFLMALPGESTVELGSAVAIVKIFKMLRITRLLKFSRYISAFSLFGLAIKKKTKQIIFSVVVIAFLICVWSILLYSFENTNNPQIFKNGFSGILYACQIILGEDVFFDTSIMNQLTPMGNALVVIMMLSGGCMIGVPLGIISGEFGKMVEMANNENEKEDVFEDLIENLSFEDKEKIIAEYLPKILSERANK